MSSLFCLITSYLVNSFCDVALIAGAGWVVSRLLKRFGPSAQHVVWVATLALAVITPVPPLCRSLFGVAYSPGAVHSHPTIVFAVERGARSLASNTLTLPPILVLALSIFYVASLLYFVIRFCWLLHRTNTLLRQASPVLLGTEGDELWSRCKRAYSVKNALILTSRQIASPVTMGFIRPVLIVPEGFVKQCTPQDLLATLAHECAHMKRRDFQKNLCYEIASLVIGFHPVTWILKSQIAQTREMICDGMATKQLIDSHTYTQSLLRLAMRMASTSRVSCRNAIGIFDANILEKRIMVMRANTQQFSSGLRYGLMMTGALFLISAAGVGGAMALSIEAPSPSQTSNPSKPYGKTYKVGKDVSAPRLVSAVDPVYPASEKVKGAVQGVCVVDMIVDGSGLPRNVHVARPLSPDFDRSAIKAVEQYRFKPAVRLGEPVAVSISVEVTFKKY